MVFEDLIRVEFLGIRLPVSIMRAGPHGNDISMAEAIHRTQKQPEGIVRLQTDFLSLRRTLHEPESSGVILDLRDA
ncbi:MAG: hypothetical protein ACI8P0_006289 [Planctomycetaceae bacterium]|jgi:hypothetical protein